MGAVSGRVTFAIAGLIALLAVYLASHSLPSKFCSPVCPSNTTGVSYSGYFSYEWAGRPHHSSWSTWWHSETSNGTPSEHTLGAGAITKDWNIIYHLGGNGPWVEKLVDVVEGDTSVPPNCEVEQVHMVGH